MADSGVAVIIRVRPLNKREIRAGESDLSPAFEVTKDSLQSVNIPPQLFTFDNVLDATATNIQAYNHMKEIVTGAMEGVNGTIFA